MLNFSDKEWKSWNIMDEMDKFFILRWNELFSDDSYESWQVRTCNVLTILLEIVESAQIASKVKSHHTNIKNLLDELKYTAKEDIIVKRYYPNTFLYLDKMIAVYKSESSKNNPDYEHLKKISEVLISIFHDYQDRITQSMRTLFIERPEKYKKELSALLLLYAIHLKSKGFSDEYIRSMSETFQSDHSMEFSKRMEDFFSCFNGARESYECYFLVRTAYKTVNPSVSDIILIDRLDVPDFDGKEEFLQQDKNANLFKIVIEDIDSYSAGQAAYKNMLIALSLRKIYEPSVPESFVHSMMVVRNKNGSMQGIKINSDSPHYIKDSNNPNENYKRLLDLLDRIQIKDRNYIQASLQYYRLSLLANNHESKLVNLWIAIESLFQENEGNIIGNITTHIPVIMARNYVKDILRSVSVDLRFLWRKEPCKELLDLSKKSNPYMVHPQDLLRMLLKEEGSTETGNFKKYIAENPLLLFRVDNLKKGLFHSPRYLRDRLERHKQNIDWQLRRVYRIRNRIMHQGLVNIDTSQFYRHLHTYYINTIHEIIHILEKNPQWSLGHVFSDIMLDYEFFIGSLGKEDTFISLDTVYYSSIKRHSDESVWVP